MTLGVTIDQLKAARAEQQAIVAAVAYDIVGLEAIVAAGEQTGQPVIAQVGSSAFEHVDSDALIAAALSLATSSTAPIGLHLDHSQDPEQIRRCLDRGYTSVMIDGSRLEFSDNIELTRQVVEIARPYGAWVEAELGHIAGNEDRSSEVEPGAMTDPTQASTFVAETGIDALAVCIGNVHGRTSSPVALDLDRLRQIAESITSPLVLHGTSGVAAATVADVVELGVAKLNVNADLRAAYLGAVARHAAARTSTDDGSSTDDLPGALRAANEAVTACLVDLIQRHARRDPGDAQKVE